MSGFVRDPSGSRWQLTNPAARELEKLNDAALIQRVITQLQRYERGETLVDGGSIKPLPPHALMQLKQNWDGNTTYRLIFSQHSIHGPVILGLHFFQKKSSKGNSTQDHHIELAKNRLKDWLKNRE